MKKILFITEHPAPYWDDAFNNFNNLSNFNVIYIDEFVNSKPWKNYIYYPGIFYNQKVTVLLNLFKSKNIIIGGYYRKELRFILFLSLILRKNIILFSDVPNNNKRTFTQNLLKSFVFKRIKLFFISGKQGIDFFHKTYNIDLNKLVYLPYSYKSLRININDNKKDFNKFNVLISSRFLDRKGHIILVKALEMCSSNMLKSFHFIFLGEGPLKNEINMRLKSINNLSFQLCGWVSFDRYNYYLDKCNILVHPSLFEPFGIPVIDALNKGLIVISSDSVMSAFDFINHGINGFIYPSKNYIKLYDLLRTVYSKKYNLSEISKLAMESVPKYSYFVKNAIEKI